MIKKNTFFIIVLSFILFSCKNGQKKSLNSDTIIKADSSKNLVLNVLTEVKLKPSGDTDYISIKLSNVCLKIFYNNNKPKFFNLNDKYVVDTVSLNYRRDNRGVYLGYSDSGYVKGLGCKYINESKGTDLVFDRKGKVTNLTSWDTYDNDGNEFDLKNIKNGKIIMFSMKEGEIIDTTVFKIVK